MRRTALLLIVVLVPLAAAQGSPSLNKDKAWSMTFDEVGEFAYYCKPHRSMVGTVTVAEDAPEGDLAGDIKDFLFAPAEFVVRPGATITWTNRDAIIHTVTFSDDGENATPLAPALALLALVGVAILVRRRG